MMSIKATHVLAVLSVVVLLMAGVHQSAAANCTLAELRPCLPAITDGQDPTPLCCNRMKEQQPCFCQYLSNPADKPFIDHPNTRKAAGTCGVTIPTAC